MIQSDDNQTEDLLKREIQTITMDDELTDLLQRYIRLKRKQIALKAEIDNVSELIKQKGFV